jgi:hypothetical protein
MLIDSYPLQRAVIGSGIPAQMMRSLDTLNVTGLGVLADGLRKLIAVRKTLLGPADWRGVTFAAFRARENREVTVTSGAGLNPRDDLRTCRTDGDRCCPLRSGRSWPGCGPDVSPRSEFGGRVRAHRIPRPVPR